MMQIGQVSYAEDVSVFHPAQCRKIARESASARARYFEKDPLLLAKHPWKYNELFHKERHWKNTPGFWSNFERGAQQHHIDVTDYLHFKNEVTLLEKVSSMCDAMETTISKVIDV